MRLAGSVAYEVVVRCRMNDEDLNRILRVAWKIHRLDAIRKVVQETIAELRALDPQDLLGRELTGGEEPVLGPVHAALETCCDELRGGCGLSLSEPSADRAPPTGARAATWVHSYASALERYRQAAGLALQTSLDRLAPAATTSV